MSLRVKKIVIVSDSSLDCSVLKILQQGTLLQVLLILFAAFIVTCIEESADMASTGPAVAATVAKTIKEVCRKPPAHWVGDGFNVIPVLANKAFTNDVSPFLMFDYAAPKEFAPTNKRLGVGQHPHRGFETVTLALQGEVEHGDSVGNRGTIGPGDVQWMTAARGIVHEEFHSTAFAKRGGVMEMCQIWVNLPSSKKMIKPNYQEIKKNDIPVQNLVSESCNANGTDTASDGSVRIIAGIYRGVQGAANTHSPVNMWDVKIGNTERTYDFEIEVCVFACVSVL